MLLLAYASALRCVVSAAMPTLVCALLLLPINVAACVSRVAARLQALGASGWISDSTPAPQPIAIYSH